MCFHDLFVFIAQRSTVEDVLKSIETQVKIRSTLCFRLNCFSQAKIMLIIAKVKLDTITITLKVYIPLEPYLI